MKILVCLIFMPILIFLAAMTLTGIKDDIEEKKYVSILGAMLFSAAIVWVMGFLMVIGFDMRSIGFEFADWLAAGYFMILWGVLVRMNYLQNKEKPEAEESMSALEELPTQMPLTNPTDFIKEGDQEKYNHQYWKKYYNASGEAM